MNAIRAGFPLALLLAACTDAPPAPTQTAPPSPTAGSPGTDTSAVASAAAGTSAAPSASASGAAAAPLPDAITHASTSPEPGPSILAEARVDGAALRTRHVDRLKHDVSAVTLLQGGSPHDLGKRICEAAVPRRSPSTPVLLKPNLCGFDSIKDPRKTGGDDGVRGRTTDPEFTRGVIHCLKERGHQTITVAEGCGHSHKHWLELMDLNGYAAMTRAEGVRLVAMDDDGVFDTQGDRPGQPLAITGIAGTRVPTLLLPRILAEHLDRGLFISLPKLKTHRYSVISVGIKNMQGTVMLSDGSPAYKQKWRMHRELNAYIKQRKAKEPEDRKLYVDSLRVFAERMVDVLEISAPDVVLAEGAPAMGGDGFQVLQPSAEHVAIGGTNPVLVDRIAAEFLGLWNHPRLAAELLGHRTSPLIESAARRFQLDLRAPAVTGDGADLLKQPRPAHFKAMAPFAIHQAAPATAPATAPAPVTSASVPELPSTPLPAPAPPAPPAPASPAPSSTAAGATGAAPPGKPTAHAAPLGSDTLTLDGRGDEPAWARAAVAAWDTDFTGSATGIRTTARFLWSPDALHVLFELSRSGLFTDRAQPVDAERQKLYTEDCVEIFLTPDPASPRRYVEVEIGPFGHFLDLSVDLDARKYVTTWSSGLRRATTQRPAAHQATIEASLTAPEITRALRAGARLPMGLFRMEGRSPRHYLAWSPPRGSKPNFHVPAAFGALVLDPPVP